MEKQEFKIAINALPQKVWDILWNDSTYPLWTAPFSEGSRAETDWQEGSKVLFLNNEAEGMVSTIAKKVPNEFMSFKHLGYIKDGAEDLTSEKTRSWAGALENYFLADKNGKTELTVVIDITKEHIDYFNSTFPKALDKVKELSEN